MALRIEWRPRAREEELKKLVAKYGGRVFKNAHFSETENVDFKVVNSSFLRDAACTDVYTLATVYKKGVLTADEKQTIINLARIRYGG